MTSVSVLAGGAAGVAAGGAVGAAVGAALVAGLAAGSAAGSADRADRLQPAISRGSSRRAIIGGMWTNRFGDGGGADIG